MTRRRLIYAAYGLAALLALSLLLTGVLWGVQAGRVLPNTSVAGHDVSLMSRDEVEEELATLVDELGAQPVVFAFEDERHEILPSEVAYQINVEASADAAMSRGRNGLPGDLFERVRSLYRAVDLEPVDTYDEELVRVRISNLSSAVDRDRSPGEVRVNPDTLEVEVQMPHGSARVRQEEAVGLLTAAVRRPGREELDLPVDTEPPHVPEEDVRAVAAQAERSVAAPLQLTAAGEEFSLAPADLARIIESRGRETEAGGATLELVVSSERLGDVIGEEILGRIQRSPENFGYEVGRVPPRTFDAQGSTGFSPVPAEAGLRPGRVGTQFDAAPAAERIAALLREGTRQGELPVERIPPDFTEEEAQQLRPTHLIGTFTTYHAAGEPRVQNIQKLADVIDGTLVLPGEQFSINEISGPRSCDKGYVPAPTIIQGELEDTCGGGTSQFGTTTFNAAFFAGVQLDRWRAHSWYISRYPMGREATLSYPALDVRFTNNTAGAIVVKTTYTSGSITVSLYGRPLAETVRASHGEPTNPTEPTEIRRNTSELSPGRERVIQSGKRGFTVTVTRTVGLIEGGEETQTIRTVYQPQDRIVEVGAG